MTAPAATDRQRQAPREMLRNLSLEIHERARREGLTLSQLLDRELTEAPKGEALDGFQRMLAAAGIVTKTHRTGWYRAGELMEFARDERTRALFPEFVRRTVDSVRFRLGQGESPHALRAVYLSDDTALGSALRPWDDLAEARESDRTEPAIPLEEVVAGTRFVGSDGARAVYLNRSAAQTRRKRVTEAADIPRAKLTTGQHEIRLYKYGVALEASYESMRRIRIDQFARFLRLEAIQAEIDKVATALDVMVNGDGNAGTAGTEYNLTTLDPDAAAGTLTLLAWLAFKAKFANPYMLTHALANEDMILQLLLLNVGSANVQLNQRPDLGGFTPINQTFADGVRWGITTDAPNDKIVGYDRRFATGRVVETGSEIQEIDRWITRQVEVLVVSESEGYETIDSNSVKLLDVAQ